MNIIITSRAISEIKEEKRNFGRLKNLFFSLYEVEEELSKLESSRTIGIYSDEYDYRVSLKEKQVDIKTKITNLLSQEYDSKTKHQTI